MNNRISHAIWGTKQAKQRSESESELLLVTRSNDNHSPGMSTHSSSKQKPAAPGQTSPYNAQLSVNSTSDVLSQSRNIINGQDWSHLPHIEQQGGGGMDTGMDKCVSTYAYAK